MTPRQEAMVATCICGWQTVCLPGDEHGPVTRLLEHRATHPKRVDPYRCDCGGTNRNRWHHIRSNRHQQWLERLAA